MPAKFEKTSNYDLLPRLVIILSALSSTGCNPPRKIIESGNLGKPVEVSGSLNVVFQSATGDERNVHAVALAAAETTTVIFCRYTGAMQCQENQSTATVFQKNTQQGFYFTSTEPVNFPARTKLLFIAYISKNGSKPTQSAIVDFVANATTPIVSSPGNTGSTGSTVNSLEGVSPIAPVQPSQTNFAGLDIGTISSILQQLMNTGATPVVTPISQPNINPQSNINPQPIAPGGQSSELVPNPEGVALSPTEFEVIRLTNSKRKSLGLSILKVQGRIMASSRESSRLMKQRSSMVHGLTSGWSRENIAMGHSTAAAVVNGWINSQGHYLNMTARNNVYIGVGDTAAQGSGIYWTQQFN